jgi:hypothetical protein
VKCRQSNSTRSGERSGGYYNQQGRKPLRHLGMSRGDGGLYIQAYMLSRDSALLKKAFVKSKN